MKNILNFNADKYATNERYTLVENNIYKDSNPPDKKYNLLERLFRLNGSQGYKYSYGGNTHTSSLEPTCFVTSLSFEQEPEFGEGDAPTHISQYPTESILDKYHVWVSDFYTDLNENSKETCYYEFASRNLEDVKMLRELIGMHVYLKPRKNSEDEYDFVVEQ